FNYTTSNGLPDEFVYGIAQDNDGNTWLATRYGGACRFVGNNIEVFNTENGFFSDHLNDVYKDSRGNIWFASLDKGLIKYNGTDFINYTMSDGLISNQVTTVFEDKNGLLWIGTDYGVTTFNGNTFFEFSEKEGFPKEEINVILQDQSGDIWIGIHSGGIYRYDGRKITKHTGLETDEIRSGYVDKRGDVWFGTFLGGLNRLPKEWFEIYPTYDGIRFNDVYSITEDNLGRMYFGHFDKGISVFDKGKFTNLNQLSGLISNNVSSLLFDNQFNLWAGTIEGVTRFKNNRTKSFSSNNGLNLDEVWRIYQDSEGFIWFGATGGVCKYDPSTEKIVEIYSEEAGFQKNSYVNHIYEDNRGVLWFATHYSGLITYDGKQFSKIDTSEGLPYNNIISVIQDHKGYYWFGSDGRGIYRYDGYEFLNITEKDGLSSDQIYFILEYDQELYIGTLNGISILNNNFDKSNDEYQFRYITKNEGIPSEELNQGAYYRDSKGFLWFGTLEGLIKIDPNKEVQNEHLSVFLSGITVSDGLNDWEYSEKIDNELNYEQNNITIQFYSISFAKPEETVFEFMLEGIEKHWTKTKNTSVTYRALPPGTYKFWARAKNHSESNSKAELLTTFTILSPFYKTWWFISSSFLSIAMFIYGLYFYKTYHVKKRNAALEAMVKDRTSELEVEKNKADELLHNILPSSLVDELKLNGSVRPRRFNSVSIMFTDFKAFTYTTSVLPPEELVY
ncbi:MAG: two-component regulator propeller domain-containing protein, partial [Melioribacteraceae bacterium]|nr:two-component regulator propeller domain-containing protein [Melioribacteraceae bacterium]